MRIAVITAFAPFVTGGGELQSQWLVGHLRARGHTAELIRLPQPIHPPQALLQAMLSAQLTRVDQFDRVIALRFPGYLVPHDDVIVWCMHQLRELYDLWGTRFSPFPDTPESRWLQRTVAEVERRALARATRLYVNSPVTARRMRCFNGLVPEVLFPPLEAPERYRSAEPEAFVFFPSRVAPTKRQELAVEAMRHVRARVRLIVAGAADDSAAGTSLNWLVRLRRLGGRVELKLGWLPEAVKLDLLARCLGVVFVPYDEDFGYVTLEAFLSSKPVVTCTDSGGPVELVEHGHSGWIVPPEPRAIAAAIDRLAEDPVRAARMGAAGCARIRELDLTWDHVVDELTR